MPEWAFGQIYYSFISPAMFVAKKRVLKKWKKVFRIKNIKILSLGREKFLQNLAFFRKLDFCEQKQNDTKFYEEKNIRHCAFWFFSHVKLTRNFVKKRKFLNCLLRPEWEKMKLSGKKKLVRKCEIFAKRFFHFAGYLESQVWEQFFCFFVIKMFFLDFAKALRAPMFLVAPASLRIYRNSTLRYASQ